MKKLIPNIMVASLLSLFITGNLNAENRADKFNWDSSQTYQLADATTLEAVNDPQMLPSDEDMEMVRVVVLIDRVNSIKAMDVSAMSANERKALRKELRCIKNELNSINATSASPVGGGIYLSVGAIIIIILLLLLLF